MKKIPEREKLLISNSIKSLAENPHPVGHKKLVGSDATYRIRIGNYRVIYDIIDQELVVMVVRVKHRKDVYR